MSLSMGFLEGLGGFIVPFLLANLGSDGFKVTSGEPFFGPKISQSLVKFVFNMKKISTTNLDTL